MDTRLRCGAGVDEPPFRAIRGALVRCRDWYGIIDARTRVYCNEIGDILLELTYKDNKLEKLCTSEVEMQRRRPDLKKKLRLRMNALRAADSIGDLPADDPNGRWHPLHGDLAAYWAGDLSGNWRLLVEPIPADTLSASRAIVIDTDDYH